MEEGRVCVGGGVCKWVCKECVWEVLSRVGECVFDVIERYINSIKNELNTQIYA